MVRDPAPAEHKQSELHRLKRHRLEKPWSGAVKRNGDVLLVPAALFGIAFTGRAVTAALNGTAPGFFQPMAFEAVQFALLVLGWRWVPHHKVGELTG